MREFLAFISGCLFFATVFVGLAYTVRSYSCEQRWGDYEYRYSLFGGCQIKENGKWMPEDRVRFIQYD